MQANIKLELKTLTPIRMVTLMGVVATRLEGNPHFPAPPVPLAALEAKRRELEAAIAAATDGSRAAKAHRDALVHGAKGMLRQLAGYVRMAAAGSEAVLTTSGFQMARVPSPIGVVGAPLIREVRTTGRQGEVLLRWSGIHGRRAYHVYVTDGDPTAPGTAWTLTGITGKVMHRVTGLEAWRAYWFCISAIGPLGEGLKSDPAIGRAA